MKLLFLTQVLDEGDAVLGFVPRWVAGLARRCERVRVVALAAGELAHLPANVDVRVVGRHGRLLRWLRYQSFLREALTKDGFDAVLAHMVPRYALLASGPARRAGARTFLWYTHAGVDQRLLAAVERVEKVFTASSESLRVDTPRRVVTGHGIDLDHFEHRGGEFDGPPRILSVGRLTPSKDPLTILEAVAELVRRGRELRLDLVGGGLTVKDETYARAVDERIHALGLQPFVTRAGEVPYRDIPAWYQRASVVVNASSTGSIDKVVLEAWASRRIVLSCNEAVPPLCRELGDDARWTSFPHGDAAALAAGIERTLDFAPERKSALGERLRGIVARDHEVDALMARLVREMGGDA
ncbi:MAG: glycosyltransferase family 4 protein [Planctomycetes bacterium]|nr:glycosyltransferase family 4 protein [Planctomycetota bacterium]